VLTVVESPIFQKLWPLYWHEDERAGFASFIAANPDAGAVIRGSGGVRKVRWAREGTGKSGGIRVVYLTRNEAGEVYLLTLYAKSKSENISLAVLKEIRSALEA
jgi:RelE toxin of RelE / RelB toxin-antitoxin system